MRNNRRLVPIALLALAGLLHPAILHAEEAEAPSLYKRMGGYDTLAAIFDNVAPKMAADPMFAAFFSGHATDSDIRQRQRALELLCQDSGGPCRYTGRPLKTAHGGLAISTAQWSAFLQHFGDTMAELKVGAPEQQELLAMVGKYKSDIVEKP
jgi:hemoglobin